MVAPRMVLTCSGAALERSKASSVSTPPSLASSSATALPESLPLLLLSRRSISESDSSLIESDQSPDRASPRKAIEDPCKFCGLSLEPLAWSFATSAPLPYLELSETLYLSPVLLAPPRVSSCIACFPAHGTASTSRGRRGGDGTPLARLVWHQGTQDTQDTQWAQLDTGHQAQDAR